MDTNYMAPDQIRATVDELFVSVKKAIKGPPYVTEENTKIVWPLALELALRNGPVETANCITNVLLRSMELTAEQETQTKK